MTAAHRQLPAFFHHLHLMISMHHTATRLKKTLCFSRSLYVQNQTAVRHLVCACKNATSFLGWQKFFGVFRKLSCHVSSLSTLALNEDAMAPGTRWLNLPFVFQKRTCRYIRKHATTAKREGNEASSSEACGLKNIGGNSSLLRLTTLQTGVEMEREKPRENQGTNAILTSNMHCSNHGNSGRSKVWVCAAKLWESVCVFEFVRVCVLCVGGYLHKTNNRHTPLLLDQ